MKTPPENTSRRSLQSPQDSYLHGYVYGAFWAYITFLCVARLLGTLQGRQLMTDNPEASREFWASIVMWAIAAAGSSWATYRLFSRTVTMKMIYALVAFHGLGIVIRGIYPGELFFFIILSAIAVSGFYRQRKPPHDKIA